MAPVCEAVKTRGHSCLDTGARQNALCGAYLFFSVFISSLNKVPCLLFAVSPLINFHLWYICFGELRSFRNYPYHDFPLFMDNAGGLVHRNLFKRISMWIGNCYKHQEKTTPQICLMIGSLLNCFSLPPPPLIHTQREVLITIILK